MSIGRAPVTTERTPDEVRLAITGMTCASCSARIERKLSKVAGVESATVNLATEKALVSFTAPVTVEQIVAEVKKTGYGATVIDGSRPARPAATTTQTAYAVSPESAPSRPRATGRETCSRSPAREAARPGLARQKVRDAPPRPRPPRPRPQPEPEP